MILSVLSKYPKIKKRLFFFHPASVICTLITFLTISSGIALAKNNVDTLSDNDWKKERQQAIKICRSPTSEQAVTLKELARITGINLGLSTKTFCQRLYFVLDFQKSLNLSYTDVKDLTPLISLRNLKSLDLSHTTISDIISLRKINKLETLYLNATNIKKIRPLIGLKNLSELHIENTRVNNIRPISHLTNLKVVYLNDTHIRNVDSLKNLKLLEHLYLGNSRVRDLTPLKNLNKLVWLGLDNTKLIKCSPANLKELSSTKKCTASQTHQKVINELLLDIKDQLALDKIEVEISGQILRIKNAYFKFRSGQFKLDSDQSKVIQILALAFQENFQLDARYKSLKKIVIEGHSDSRNYKTFSKGNLILSQKRAEETWNSLNETIHYKNIFREMKNASGEPLFEVVGRSDSMPIIPEPLTAADNRINRRIDFVFQCL